jgi:hypothetical protein
MRVVRGPEWPPVRRDRKERVFVNEGFLECTIDPLAGNPDWADLLQGFTK